MSDDVIHFSAFRQSEVENRRNATHGKQPHFPALASLRTRAHFLPCIGGDFSWR